MMPTLTTEIDSLLELIDRSAGCTQGLVRSIRSLAAGTPGVRLIGPPHDPDCDSLPRIQAACDDLMASGGGDVWLAPAMCGYRLRAGGIMLGNGVRLRGLGGCGMAGATATCDEWAACGGAWLRPEHPEQPAVTLLGHGSAIADIGFIHDQPLPGPGWAPRSYGWCVENRAVHSSVTGLVIVNASHGIALQGTPESGGGTHVRVENCIVSAFDTRLRTSCLNDTAAMHNIHMRNLWHSSDPLVAAWIRSRTTGWRCGYTDNMMIGGLEFFEDADAVLFEDETCLGIRHSLYNAQLANLQFNLPTRCMRVAAPDTTVWAQMANVQAQTGDAFGLRWADTQFLLDSDNVDIKITGLVVLDAGQTIARVGAGAGGRLTISGLDVRQYGSVADAAPAFETAAGADLALSGVHRFHRLPAAGPRFGGVGNVRMPVQDRAVFPTFSAVGAAAGAAAAWIDLATRSAATPGEGRIQARIAGFVFVSSDAGASPVTIRLSGHPEVRASALASGPAWQPVDSGWIDLDDAPADLGRLQLQAPDGVSVTLAELNVLTR